MPPEVAEAVGYASVWEGETLQEDPTALRDPSSFQAFQRPGNQVEDQSTGHRGGLGG